MEFPSDRILKTVNPHFHNVWIGKKTAELRKHDRHYATDQIWYLQEYFPKSKEFGNRVIKIKLTHILHSVDYPEGLKDGYCVLSFQIISRYENNRLVYIFNDKIINSANI